jgi:hypothetical protein
MSAFQRAVAEHKRGLCHISGGVCAACRECQTLYGMDAPTLANALDSGALADEPHIGLRCDTCGLTCQQELYDGHAVDGGEIVHLSMCGDCLCWFANGQHPVSWPGV